jgi:hypothetical protein
LYDLGQNHAKPLENTNNVETTGDIITTDIFPSSLKVLVGELKQVKDGGSDILVISLSSF